MQVNAQGSGWNEEGIRRLLVRAPSFVRAEGGGASARHSGGKLDAKTAHTIGERLHRKRQNVLYRKREGEK